MAASLFVSEDGRFPMQMFCDRRRLDVLLELGMKNDKIPFNWIKKRTKTVKKLAKKDSAAALQRCKAILLYLSKLSIDQMYNSDELKSLAGISFLPIENRPLNWPIPWKADIYKEGRKADKDIKELKTENVAKTMPSWTFKKPNELNLTKVKKLLGGVHLIVHDFDHSGIDRVLTKVGVNSHVSVDDAVQQLRMVNGANIDDLNGVEKKQLRKICDSIYHYLNNTDNHKETDNIFHNLESMKILYTTDAGGNEILVQPRMMSFRNPQIETPRLSSNIECRPKLFFIDPDLKKYETFLKHVGVHEQFPSSLLIDVVTKLQAEFGDTPCPLEDARLIINIIKLIEITCRVEGTESELRDDQIKKLRVPDDELILRSADELCFDDDYGALGRMPFMNFVHSSVDVGLMRLLGIKSKRVQHLKSFADAMEFGQKEKLVTRLKGILQGYPRDSTILNELLQNADDAGASEIHFILDERSHSTTDIFDDSWKALQGPSLIVYNDTCFSASDIRGIQNLGEGNKSDDPTKTGQFGIGFNATYHLTDVPSFLTRGTDAPNGGTLCIFDPHCKYAPLARPDSPGMMLPNLSNVEQYYPGVYGTYLQKELPAEKGTWFRFPLRNDEMSRSSEICPKKVSSHHINDLFRCFHTNMLKVLLFVSNVQSIKISVIHQNDEKLQEPIYQVNVSLSDEDKEARTMFNKYVGEAMMTLKEGRSLLSDIEDREVFYRMIITDGNYRTAHWIIVQRFGVPKSMDCPEILTNAMKEGEIGLSPRGGVALPMIDISKYNIQKTKRRKTKTKKVNTKVKKDQTAAEEVSTVALYKEHFEQLTFHKKHENDESKSNANLSTNPKSSHMMINKQSEQGDFRVFCFLPTPIKSGLPLHINGHFILDPARRNMYRDGDSTTYKGHWNNLLLEKIIPSAYASGMEVLQKNIMEIIRSKTVPVQEVLDIYHLAFPSFEDITENSFHNLVVSLYKVIKEREMHLFPVQLHLSHKTSEKVCGVSWVALSEKGNRFPAYFNDLSDQFVENVEEKYHQMDWTTTSFTEKEKNKNKEIKFAKEESIALADILKMIGLKLVDSPLWIMKSIREASQEPEVLAPCKLVTYLQSSLDNIPDRCKIELLDNENEGTLLTNVYTLLSYCIKSDSFEQNMEDLPLLVTQDGAFRRFSSDFPVFVSWYYDLLPSSSHEFASQKLVELLHRLLGRASCLKELEVANFAKLLPFSINASAILNTTGQITWDPSSEKIPNKKWILSFWNFLSSCNQGNELKEMKVKCFQYLKHWCLIPGKQAEEYVLVSFEYGYRLLELNSFSDSDRREAFRNLQLPVPAFHREFTSSIINTFVATEQNPKSVLECLCYKREFLRTLAVADKVYNKVLQFLQGNIDINDETMPRLRSLPIYKSITGGYFSIDANTEILFLPRDVPVSGLETWGQNTDKLLLKKSQLFEQFLQQLGVLLCDEMGFYGHHLLPTFHLLDNQFHMEHLEFVRDNILPKVTTDEKSYEIKKVLKDIAFIPSNEHMDVLVKANEFYSPFNKVCAKLCSPTEFPPHPFDSREWKTFMDIAGMKRDITEDLFVSFAEQVENDGLQGDITEKLKEQSKELVSHLFERVNLEDSLLRRIKDIKFIVPHAVKQCYVDIFPSLKETPLMCFSESSSSALEHLMWTTCLLLPKYADPYYQVSEDSNRRKRFQNQMGIYTKPPPDKVISHTHNICFSLQKSFAECYQKCQPLASRYLEKTVTDLMKKIYQHLQNQDDHREIQRGLSQTPVIHVVEHKLFCSAHQAVLEISKEDEIVPYLFKSPVYYGAYFDIFKYLGCKEKVTCKHYVDVLKLQKQLIGDTALSPEDLHSTRKAVLGFFREAAKRQDQSELSEDLSDIKELYLPGEDNKLYKASCLVYCDNNSMKRRLEDVEIQYLRKIEFGKENVDIHSILVSLPACIRPTPLTELVKEELVQVSTNDIIEESENTLAIKQFIYCKEFFESVRYLILHDNHNSSNPISSEELAEVRQNIQSIEIYAIRILNTVLTYQGQIVEESMRQVDCYYCCEQDTWKLYFKEGTGDVGKRIGWRLTRLISRCANNLIKEQKSLSHLNALVGYVPDIVYIAAYLLENDINVDTDFDNIEDEWFPRLGSFVPKHEYGLLDNSFTEFRKGEYVAYEVYDPEIDNEETAISPDQDPDDPVYIYVKVVKKSDPVSEEIDNPYLMKYDVNMGEKIESVLVIRMYKFVRKQGEMSKDLVPFSDGNQGSNEAQESAILEEIRGTLIDAWKLDLKSRKRVIKRLFLSWHPDKNPGREEFCTRVFQYIQHIINELKNGNIDTNSGNKTGYSDTYTASWYSEFGDRVNRRYHDNWTHYSSSYANRRRRTRRSRRCEEYIPNPQIREARRWMKQAKADLAAAMRVLNCSCEEAKDTNVYNWICYISHQAAEKAIKAVIYSIDADKVTKNHGLAGAAFAQPNSSLRDKASQLDNHLQGYNNMRYPGISEYPKTPTELYDEETANEALSLAQEIIEDADEYLS